MALPFTVTMLVPVVSVEHVPFTVGNIVGVLPPETMPLLEPPLAPLLEPPLLEWLPELPDDPAELELPPEPELLEEPVPLDEALPLLPEASSEPEPLEVLEPPEPEAPELVPAPLLDGSPNVVLGLLPQAVKKRMARDPSSRRIATLLRERPHLGAPPL
jgi:hypothetical protein